MPRIIPRSQGSAPDLGSLREIVWVCTTTERPDADVSTIVKHPGVIRVHARVRPLKGSEVLNWKAVFQSPQTPTHEIIIRTPPDVKIDIRHWCFCADRYAESWYRVMTVEDMGGVRRFTVLLCTLETTKDRRSDLATQPLPPRHKTPDDDVVEAI
jgi:hypothetical protein